MPYGAARAAFRSFRCCSSKPSLVMSNCTLALSSTRRHAFSPNSVGITDTRKSTSLFAPSFSLMRPSWGSRRSAISSLAMIFTRDTIAFFTLSGRFITVIIFLDRFEQRRFAGDNGLDRVIGPKFEIVEAEDIGGIRHGDGQVRADPF